MKGDTLQRNNAGFPSSTGSPYYKKMPAFSGLMSKTSSLYVRNLLGVIKDCKL